MAPDPFNSSRALSLRTPPLPVRCNTLPNRFQRAVRNGLRAAGAAAFTGGAVTLAGAGSRPLGLKTNAAARGRSQKPVEQPRPPSSDYSYQRPYLNERSFIRGSSFN
ncbi:hypothetical protein Ndes2437B_g03375 [Nannochloris sp. 'desiccata']